jgi:hypothetical protein
MSLLQTSLIQQQYQPQPQPQQDTTTMTEEYDSALEGVLQDTERLIIKQEVELMEAAIQAAANAVNLDALGAFGETANKYDIFTDDGGKKFRVIETSDYCGCTGRVCCRPNHALKLHVYLPEIDTEVRYSVCSISCCCNYRLLTPFAIFIITTFIYTRTHTRTRTIYIIARCHAHGSTV